MLPAGNPAEDFGKALSEPFNLKPYARMLRDVFGEPAPIKRGAIHFRGYRISCDECFLVEDTWNYYEPVDIGGGIPTPRELADFFKAKKREFTAEENRLAAARGKALQMQAAEESRLRAESHQEREAPKRKEPPYRQVRFVGVPMPRFKIVSDLDGDLIEVNGKQQPAVPFLTEYLLSDPKARKCMPRLMAFLRGDITLRQLIASPFSDRQYQREYDPRLVREGNSVRNTEALKCLYSLCGVQNPADLEYCAEIPDGTKVALLVDGRWHYRKVTNTPRGIFLGKSYGYLRKDDCWVLLEDLQAGDKPSGNAEKEDGE